MQKLTILTVVILALWVAAFGLPGHSAIAWQSATTDNVPEQSEQQTTSEDTSEPPANALPEIDPKVAAEAASLLQQARDRLYSYRTVDATLVERAAFGNRRMKAEGRYQAGAFPYLRVEYTFRVGESEGVLQEVCDGQILRTSRHIQPVGAEPDSVDPSQYQVTRKDVGQILQASGGEGSSAAAILQAEMGIGGLPALLASIERCMEFDTVQRQMYQGKSYQVLEGRWKQEFLERLNKSPEMAAIAQQVVPFMPDRVAIYLHEETKFPMRILYLKQVTADPVTHRAVMSIEFSDVKLDQGLDPKTFRFIPPPGVAEVDETSVYVEMIRREAAAASAAQDGAEPAANASGPAKPDAAETGDVSGQRQD